MIDTLPRVVVGTSSLGSVVPFSSPDSRTLDYLDEVLALGCTAFDLAASYQVGGTERLFGAWMASRRNRSRVFLISKGAHPVPVIAPHRLNARAIENDLHASLKRLQTDHVDQYFLHRDDESAPLEPVVEALARFRKQGKIRAWGTSNFTIDRMTKIDALARDVGERVAMSSTQFSLFEFTRPPFPGSVSATNSASRAFHETSQMPLLAWSPLGAGFASGHAKSEYDTPTNRARRDRAKGIAKERGVSATQIALAYVLSQPFPTHVVVASKSASRMQENLDATKITLTHEEMATLETAAR